MKKRKNTHKIDCVPIQNPVAKFAHQFNKAHIFEDKNNYRRNAKHRKQEASPIALLRAIREVSCVLRPQFVFRGLTLLNCVQA